MVLLDYYITHESLHSWLHVRTFSRFFPNLHLIVIRSVKLELEEGWQAANAKIREYNGIVNVVEILYIYRLLVVTPERHTHVMTTISRGYTGVYSHQGTVVAVHDGCAKQNHRVFMHLQDEIESLFVYARKTTLRFRFRFQWPWPWKIWSQNYFSIHLCNRPLWYSLHTEAELCYM